MHRNTTTAKLTDDYGDVY